MKPKFIIFIGLILILSMATWAYWEYTKTGSPLPKVAQNESKAAEEQDQEQILKNYGSAPELTGLTKWLNGDPQTLASLKGKVVLVNFWTYSSITSIRALPHINKWSVDYMDRGFAVVSIHTPQFTFEKIQANVDAAVKRYKLTYPVAMDNNYKTWNAFGNQFWPAEYLIDKDGNIVYTQFGEGNYDKTEKVIRTLLGLEGPFDVPPAPETSQSLSPQMYLGLLRLKNFGGSETPNTTEQLYAFPGKLKTNQFALEGNWQFNQESAIHTKGFGKIKLNFNAAKVFLVAQSADPTTIKVYVDGELIKGVVVSNSDLYQLYDSALAGKHTLEIEVPQGGFEAFTFTFG